MIHLRHRWVTVEQIGLVITQQCTTCRKTRIRIQGDPVSDDLRVTDLHRLTLCTDGGTTGPGSTSVTYLTSSTRLKAGDSNPSHAERRTG